MLSRLSDFVVCSTSLNIWKSGVTLDLISENEGNLLIFRENDLDLRPNQSVQSK